MSPRTARRTATSILGDRSIFPGVCPPSPRVCSKADRAGRPFCPHTTTYSTTPGPESAREPIPGQYEPIQDNSSHWSHRNPATHEPHTTTRHDRSNQAGRGVRRGLSFHRQTAWRLASGKLGPHRGRVRQRRRKPLFFLRGRGCAAACNGVCGQGWREASKTLAAAWPTQP